VVRQRRSANRLETEGPQSDETTGEARDESNVIRLPRDWLGPREELVPFGTPAEEPAPAVEVESRGAEQPPRAAAFWGEESAAVQDALPAPAAEQPSPQAPRSRRRPLPRLRPRPRPRPRSGPRLRPNADHRFRRRISYGIARAGRESQRLTVRPTVPRTAAWRAIAATAVGAVLLTVGAVLVGLPGTSRPAAGGGPESKSSGLAVVFPPVLTGVANWPLSRMHVARHPARPAVHRVRVSRSRRVRPLPPARYIPVSTRSASTPSQPAPTRYVAPVSTPASSPRTQVTTTPQSTAPAYHPPATSAAATKVTAFGPSGVLGPGSSRNG
jgi:hypothetical protein